MRHVAVAFNTETSKPVGVLKLYQPDALLTDGETVIVYDEEIEVEAVVAQDKQTEVWLAVPDWATKQDMVEQRI